MQIGSRISCCDGWVGTLQQLRVDAATGKTSHLVIEMTLLGSQHAIVPVEHVIGSGFHTVFLDLTSAQMGPYRRSMVSHDPEKR